MEHFLTGVVATDKASQYLTQLCKHWSHRFTATHTPKKGAVEMPFGKLELEANDRELGIKVALAEAGGGDTAKKVIAEHLNRFAFREAPLTFVWSDDAKGNAS